VSYQHSVLYNEHIYLPKNTRKDRQKDRLTYIYTLDMTDYKTFTHNIKQAVVKGLDVYIVLRRQPSYISNNISPRTT